MLRSMTGYGKVVHTIGETDYTLELRSLNHKGTQVQANLPARFREREIPLRRLISDRTGRGKIDLFVRPHGSGMAQASEIDRTLFEKYYRELATLKETLGDREDKGLMSLVMQIPDVMREPQSGITDAEVQELEKGVERVLGELEKYALAEGETLYTDLKEQVDTIRERLKVVEEKDPQRVEKKRERLKKELENAMGREEYDADRFEQELVHYLDKLDLNEEKVRLNGHCAYFIETMEENAPNGKKLEFIAQEMGREINTIGSKAQDEHIQRAVVQMKDALGKIREQVMNVM